MRRGWRITACGLLCCILVWFLADAGRTRAAAGEALALCARSVIPALFPFLVVSTLLVSLGFGRSSRLAGLMTPLFRQPGSAGTALVLGLVGGVLLEMNGKRYDNTLRHRLEAIHAALTAEA